MNKKTLLTAAIALALGFGLSNAAISSNGVTKIATVDVAAVVNKSAQVQSLKKEQAKKTEEIQKWLNTVKADVEKQQSQEGKQKLLKKYNEEYAKKQEDIRKTYQTKLQAIDKSITATITQEAKKQGYDMVISKSVVIFGGNDITSAVSKVVK